jgi:hypothetical protein
MTPASSSTHIKAFLRSVRAAPRTARDKPEGDPHQLRPGTRQVIMRIDFDDET